MMKQCLEVYSAQAARIWRYLPEFVKNSPLGGIYGRHVHRFVCRYSRRRQNHSTFFLRNRPEMDVMCRLLSRRGRGSRVDLTVLACSKGAEVYSILWSIRRSRPDLKISLQALDISQDIVDFARQGVYSLKRPAEALKGNRLQIMAEEDAVTRNTLKDQGPDQSASIFERLDQREMDAIFDREDDRVTIKAWLKDGITWRTGDASAPELVDA
jgi:chemotaxis methyl-accepting protein methylase